MKTIFTLLLILFTGSALAQDQVNPSTSYTEIIMANSEDLNVLTDPFSSSEHLPIDGIRILLHPEHPEYISYWFCKIKIGHTSKAQSKDECRPMTYNPLNPKNPFTLDSFKPPVWLHATDLQRLDQNATRAYKHSKGIIEGGLFVITFALGAGAEMALIKFIHAGKSLFLIPKLAGVIVSPMVFEPTILGTYFLVGVLFDNAMDEAVQNKLGQMDLEHDLFDESEKLMAYVPIKQKTSYDFLNRLNEVIRPKGFMYKTLRTQVRPSKTCENCFRIQSNYKVDFNSQQIQDHQMIYRAGG